MFGRKQRVTLGFTRVKITTCAAFCSGTGLRSRNSQSCTTRFRISELGNLVQNFLFFLGMSSRLFNYRTFVGFVLSMVSNLNVCRV